MKNISAFALDKCKSICYIYKCKVLFAKPMLYENDEEHRKGCSFYVQGVSENRSAGFGSDIIKMIM